MKNSNRSSRHSNRHAAPPMAEINIIPLVDIVLVLLIIFMATTAFVNDAGLNTALPQAKTADATKELKTISVTISQNGALYLDGKQSSESAVQRAFAAAKSSQPRIVIRGDENIEYRRVVRIMDLARQEGLSKITLSTRPS